jgi:hypothetical protein
MKYEVKVREQPALCSQHFMDCSLLSIWAGNLCIGFLGYVYWHWAVHQALLEVSDLRCGDWRRMVAWLFSVASTKIEPLIELLVVSSSYAG